MKNHSSGLVSIVASGMLAAGCAPMTEQERYDLREQQARNGDQIRIMIANCEAAGHVVIYTGPRKSKLIDPVKRVPRNAHPGDYNCTSTSGTERALRSMGTGLR